MEAGLDDLDATEVSDVDDSGSEASPDIAGMQMSHRTDSLPSGAAAREQAKRLSARKPSTWHMLEVRTGVLWLAR